MNKYIYILFLSLYCCGLFSQVINYDEEQVVQYILPDPLKNSQGYEITSSEDWFKHRDELLQVFASNIYGKYPERTPNISFAVLSEDKTALGGKATRREIAISIEGNQTLIIPMLMYIPNKRKAPAPLFLMLNFKGNHSINEDPMITKSVFKEKSSSNKALDFARGAASSRWPLEMIVDSGYAVATMYRGDIDPDYDDGFQNGIHPLFYKDGQSRPLTDEWGTVAAWSWGLSRAMDYLETDKEIDPKKVVVMGHSRLGKAALWAGATDQRFAMVVSNNSGCGGAALFRRNYGETAYKMNTLFPHWFCQNFLQYNDNEDSLSVDQHQLIALIAPRPVYIASASEDKWADPKGEFLSGLNASPVYSLFGKQGIAITELPSLNTPSLDGFIGYHMREGKHDITYYDWQQYIKFANKHLLNDFR